MPHHRVIMVIIMSVGGLGLAFAQPVPLPPGAGASESNAGTPAPPNMSCGQEYSPAWDNCVGVVRYPNGNVYQGEFHHGQRDGLGVIAINATGVSDQNNILSKEPSIYAGEFRGNRLNGHGVWFTRGGAGYSGTFMDNIPQPDVSQKNCSGPPPSWNDCVAAVRYGNGNLYRGEFMHGQREGIGMLVIMPMGTSDARSIRMPVTPAIYVGEFKGDRLNGKGMVFMRGAGFYGMFTDNIFQVSSQTAVTPRVGEYGHYDAKQVVTLATSGNRHSATINFSYLDRIIDDLASHAADYPPQFDSADDLVRARRDVTALSAILNTLVTGPSPDVRLLLRAGVLNSFGHNLDLPDASERAVADFTALLKQAPDNPRANYYYGKFLADAGKPADAIPLLEKARSLGLANASYPLGIAYLMTGEKNKALESLEAYARQVPGNTNVAKMIDAIRSGSIQIKKAN